MKLKTRWCAVMLVALTTIVTGRRLARRGAINLVASPRLELSMADRALMLLPIGRHTGATTLRESGA